MNGLSLRTRLVLLVMLAVVVPAAAMGVHLVQQREHDIRKAQNTLAAAARDAGRELESKVNGTTQLLFGLSESRELETADLEACSVYLERVKNHYPQYTGILTIKPDGQLHCDSLRTGRKLDLNDRAYFKQAMASTEPAYDLVFGRLTGIGVLQVALAARDTTGAVKFVLLASIDLKQFAEEVAKAQPYPNSVLPIFDRSGTMMAGYAGPGVKSQAGKNFADSDLFRFAGSAKSGDTTEITGLRGIRRIWAAGAPPESWNIGLVLALGVPTADLVADAESRMRSAFAFLASASLLAFAAALIFSDRGLRKPLLRIVGGFEKLRQGELDARIGTPYPAGEIGEVMRAFDRTADELQAQQDARRQAEEEALSLRQELEQRVARRTEELAEAIKGLESFSYSVSHDLRTPLRAISGFAQILARRHRASLEEEGRHYLDNIVRASAQMGRLIEDLLGYARLGRRVVKLEPIELGGVLSEVLHDLEPRVKELGAELRLPEEPPVVLGDSTLLFQIFLNLIENALTYRHRDVRPQVAITCRLHDGHATVCVEDNGIGISPEHFDTIFGVFQRLHSQDDYPGTGIGLATVKRAAQMLQARVWVESTPGAGSRFFVELAASDPATGDRYGLGAR
ncbi:MAG: ATP-binding protein [Betaproteobacteria bacterium]